MGDKEQDSTVESTSFTLPRWKSHKIVSGFKIAKIHFNDGYPILESVPTDEVVHKYPVSLEYINKLPHNLHSPKIGGYFVLYEDGYQSWSPAEAFESSCSRIE